WEFESKEPRRCLNGPHPYESERPPIKMRANWFFCGFPNLRKSSEPGPEIYEREIDYLQRLKLLTPEEKRIAKTLCDKDQPRTLQEHFEQIKHTDYGPIMKALSFEP
ncbi:MAG TPA: hypothetical protein PLQ45_07775, partial [Anaerohalosphaeraceae bacterium]|nr:hypothetical protein [Anaerohalosphaeraceae bacterium]